MENQIQQQNPPKPSPADIEAAKKAKEEAVKAGVVVTKEEKEQ